MGQGCHCWATTETKNLISEGTVFCFFFPATLLNNPQENESMGTIPTEMDSLVTNPDLDIPRTYPEEPLPGRERVQRAPAQFQDTLPEPPQPVFLPRSRLPTVYLIVTNPLKTALNSFGIFRQYLFHPSHDPDALVNPSDLSNLPTHHPSLPLTKSKETDRDPPWPFANMSTWRLMHWVNTGTKSKSKGEVDRLVNNVLNASDFRAEDLHNFSTHRENRRFDAANKATPLEDSFQVTSISIEVPTGQPADRSPPRKYLIPGLHYRKLLNIIKAAFQDPLSKQLHFTPFTLMHRSLVTSKEQRVYSELYNSDEFINEHKRVQNRSPPPPDDPGCKLEKVIAALMFWSDSTHLANFGTAALWPIYLYFGNLSKYIRSQPSSGACHHLAYIPSVRISNVPTYPTTYTSQLPDSFESWISGWHPHWDTQRSQLMAHCRRELIHAVWKYILDDDFIHAMRYGIIVTCHDGVRCRIYPRIFTYSADYPEK